MKRTLALACALFLFFACAVGDCRADAQTANEPQLVPPESLARYRHEKDRALVLGHVRYVDLVTLKTGLTDSVTRELVKIEVLHVEWTSEPDSVGSFSSGASMRLQNVVNGTKVKALAGLNSLPESPPRGFVVEDRVFWFVLAGNGFEDYLSIVAAAPVAATQAASAPADDRTGFAPPERFARFRDQNDHALVLVRIRDVDPVVEKTLLRSHVREEQVRMLVLAVEWNTRPHDYPLYGARTGERVLAINAPTTTDGECPRLGSIAVDQLYWFVLDGSVRGDALIVAAAPADRSVAADKSSPPESLARFRNEDNRTLVRGLVLDVEPFSIVTGITDSHDGKLIEIKVTDVPWKSTSRDGPERFAGDVFKAVEGLRSLGRGPRVGSTERGKSYWFVIAENAWGDLPGIVASADAN